MPGPMPQPVVMPALPDLGAVSSFLATIDSLIDHRAERRAKLEELIKARDAAQAVVDLAGPAADVLRLRDEATAARDEAAATLGRAKVEAKAITDAAKASAATVAANASAAAREQQGRLDAQATAQQQTARDQAAQQARLDQDEATLNERKAIEAQREADLKAAQAEAQAAKEAAAAMKARYEKLLATLETVS